MATIFSKACKYAIKATIFLAKNSSKEACVRVKEISLGIDAPEYFVAKILQELNKKKFIVSVKGPNGGFYITDKQAKIPVAKIVFNFDGDDILSSCVLGLDECSSKNPCPMHMEYIKIKDGLKKMLSSNSIEEFRELVFLNEAVLKNEQ